MFSSHYRYWPSCSAYSEQRAGGAEANENPKTKTPQLWTTTLTNGLKRYEQGDRTSGRQCAVYGKIFFGSNIGSFANDTFTWNGTERRVTPSGSPALRVLALAVMP
jgi:hypothetical protein